MTANRDDFDVSRFRSELPEAVRERDDLAVLIASEDNTAGSYHALLGWTITNEEISLNIEYRSGSLDTTEGEPLGEEVKGPPAEALMLWLGQFFATDSIVAHAHARFRFAANSRDTTFNFALAGELPHSARLYGLALQLPTKPDGIVSVRLTRGQSDWYAEIVGEREVVFGEFSPLTESESIGRFLDLFLKETQE